MQKGKPGKGLHVLSHELTIMEHRASSAMLAAKDCSWGPEHERHPEQTRIKQLSGIFKWHTLQ